jgi:hypothetical protein
LKVALLTSVSANIADIASATVPNKLEYCLRHGYSLIVKNEPYDQAVANMPTLCRQLDQYDFLWSLDADTVITNMAVPIHELPCIGPHLTVCEEGCVDWNLLNCGSLVWRDTPETRCLILEIAASRSQWQHLPCIWQTWLQNNLARLGDAVTVAPMRSFNSCVWNRPANSRDEVGGHWQPGDLVYHPCGVFPMTERLRWIQQALELVQR